MKLSEEEKARRKAQRVADAKAELDAYIEKVVAEAPPFTQAQRDLIAGLLRPRRDQ